MKPELSLVIPARNEEGNIETVVRGTTKVLDDARITHELIVVDDGSTDNTAAVVRTMMQAFPTLKLVSYPNGRGYGAAIRAGFDTAKGNIVGWMDGDNQTDPVIVADLFKVLQKSGCAMAKAVRVVRNESLWRRVQSSMFNLVFRALFGFYCRDVNAKPKLLRRSTERSLHIISSDWFIDAEIVIKLSRAKAPVLEMPIEWNERQRGSSSVNFSTGFEFLKNMGIYRFGRK